MSDMLLDKFSNVSFLTHSFTNFNSGIGGHQSYNGCERCTCFGEQAYGCVRFLEKDCPRRVQEDWTKYGPVDGQQAAKEEYSHWRRLLKNLPDYALNKVRYIENAENVQYRNEQIRHIPHIYKYMPTNVLLHYSNLLQYLRLESLKNLFKSSY